MMLCFESAAAECKMFKKDVILILILIWILMNSVLLERRDRTVA